MAGCPGGLLLTHGLLVWYSLPFAALRLSYSAFTALTRYWALFVCLSKQIFYLHPYLLLSHLFFAGAVKHRNGCKESLLTLEMIGISQSWLCSAQGSCYQWMPGKHFFPLASFSHSTWLTGWAARVDWSVWQIATNVMLPTMRKEKVLAFSPCLTASLLPEFSSWLRSKCSQAYFTSRCTALLSKVLEWLSHICVKGRISPCYDC